MVLSTDLYSSDRVRGDPDEEYITVYSRISHYYPLINYIQTHYNNLVLTFSD